MFVIILSFFLLISSIVLSLYSTLILPWTSFSLDGSNYTHGLFNTFKVPDTYDRADYACLEGLVCAETETSLCTLSKKLSQARNVIVSAEALSLVLQVFLLERIILKAFKKPYGSPNYFLLLNYAIPLCKLIGIGMFLKLSEIKLLDNSKTGEVQAKEGVFIYFISFANCLLTSFLVVVFKVHRTSRFYRMQIKNSIGKFFKPMLMYFITQIIFFLSNVYPVASYNEFKVVNINIDYVNSMESYPNNLPIPCIAGQECQISPYSCKVFNSLSKTSITVSIVRSFTYLFALLWGECLIHLIMKIRFGTYFLNLVYPMLYLAFSLIGITYYIVEANLGYGTNCNIEDFEFSWTLCAELGTTFYIISTIFGFLTVAFYMIIYAIHSSIAEFGNKNTSCGEFSDDNTNNNSALRQAAQVSPTLNAFPYAKLESSVLDNMKGNLNDGSKMKTEINALDSSKKSLNIAECSSRKAEVDKEICGIQEEEKMKV